MEEELERLHRCRRGCDGQAPHRGWPAAGLDSHEVSFLQPGGCLRPSVQGTVDSTIPLQTQSLPEVHPSATSASHLHIKHGVGRTPASHTSQCPSSSTCRHSAQLHPHRLGHQPQGTREHGEEASHYKEVLRRCRASPHGARERQEHEVDGGRSR